MMLRLVTVGALAAGIIITSNAQTISFNSPLPWVTLRNDTITVRAQIDTAALKGKELSMSLQIAENGKTNTLSTKKFKLSEPSGEFAFGKIKKSLLGGESYLKFTWNIPKTEDKGEIEPIGIADLSVLKTTDTLHAAHVADNAASSEIVSATAGTLTQLGSISFGLAWNKAKFFIVVKKNNSGDTLKLALDGKCGKNAFLSFPDRIIVTALSDSLLVKGIHFQRTVEKNTMKYKEIEWQNEITQENIADHIVISMPWFDSGVIPFEERSIGAAVFSINKGKKATSSIPSAAKFFIPATWGVIQLQK